MYALRLTNQVASQDCGLHWKNGETSSHRDWECGEIRYWSPLDLTFNLDSKAMHLASLETLTCAHSCQCEIIMTRHLSRNPSSWRAHLRTTMAGKQSVPKIVPVVSSSEYWITFPSTGSKVLKYLVTGRKERQKQMLAAFPF